MKNYYNKITTKCKLDDGSIVEYDGCTTSLKDAAEFYTADRWDFIGSGVIYSIGDVLEKSDVKRYFYVRKF